MKSIPIAMVCALLGASALAPAAFAQATGGSSTTEISPPTSTQDLSGGRDRDRRDWRSTRDEDDERYGTNRNSANRSYAEEEDDVDQDGTSRHHSSPMPRGMSGGMSGGISGGMSGMMDPYMMRMHMRMMRAHHRGGEQGARLQLKRGDATIDIRCPARENISACVDAVGKLMDHVQNMPNLPSTTTMRP